jgi:hypothetical protein
VEDGKVGKEDVPGIKLGKEIGASNLENVTIGMSVRHITANRGYWRVPWEFVQNAAHKQYAVRHYLFAQCPYPDRCLGEPEMGNYKKCHLYDEGATGQANTSTNLSSASLGLISPSTSSPSGMDDTGWSASCTVGTHPDAVACGRCADGWTSTTRGTCISCSENGVGARWALVFVLVVVFVVYFALKHRYTRTLERLQLVWHDVLKLVTIVVSYQQVSSSIPAVVTIEWPQIYLDFLPYLNLLNLDFARFLSFDCVFGVNYLETLYVYTFLPVLIFVLAVLNYRLTNRRLLKTLASAQKNFTKLNAMWERGLERAFDLIDDDDSGYLHPAELAELLVAVNSIKSEEQAIIMREEVGSQKKWKSTRTRKWTWWIKKCMQRFERKIDSNFTFMNRARKIVKEYGDWNSNNEMVIYRSSFLANAKEDGRIAEKSIAQKRALIIFSQSAQVIRSTLGTAFQIIFVMHSPLSVPAFKFFDCRSFGERRFLHSDYTFDCAGDAYYFGRRFAIAVIILFGFGLPFFFGVYLYANRNALHTARLEAKFGWMYSNYRRGAEGWEIFQICRKIFLTGVLYLLGRHLFVKITFGILCSLLTLVMLVETRPFNSPLVFKVAVISGVCTCFKYAMTFLLMIPNAVAVLTLNGIGAIFLLVDSVAFGCALYMFVVIFRRAKNNLIKVDAKQNKFDLDEQERNANRLRHNKTLSDSDSRRKPVSVGALRRRVSQARTDHKMRTVADHHEITIQTRKDTILRGKDRAGERLRLRLKRRALSKEPKAQLRKVAKTKVELSKMELKEPAEQPSAEEPSGILGDATDKECDEAVKVARLKLKRLIGQARRLRKIYNVVCLKFKVENFSIEAFGLFLKIGLKRKALAPAFVQRVWKAVSQNANMSEETVTPNTMPLGALEDWIFAEE